jgi:CBS domain-containing protein
MMVGQLMSRKVCTCSPDDSLQRAAEVMSDGQCGCLPLVDDGGRIVAIVTDRDLCMAACRDGLPVTSTPVSMVASPDVLTIREDATAEEAELVMRKNCVRRLPVVDGADRPVGILSIYDLARHAYWAASKGDRLTPESVLTTEIAIAERSMR